MKEFQEAIDAIIVGANKLRVVCDDEENAVYQEPDAEQPFARVSPGAFCLKLSYKVWQDLQYEKRMETGGGSPHPLHQLAAAMRKVAGPLPESNIVTDKFRALAALFDEMTPDEVDLVAKAYRESKEEAHDKA